MAYYQHNMLSIKSRTLVANILAEVVLLSQSIQSYRQALANIDFFDCIALFRFLDRQEKGYLRQKDFQRIIGTRHRKLLTYAFSWFDNMKVGEISRLQFAVFLLPKDNLELRQLVAERVQNPQISYSQHETILEQFQIFRRLLLEIMKREMKIIQLRRNLVESQDYTSKGLLVAIDCSDHQWICSQDIYKFMKNYGFDVSLRHVQKLVEVINYNLDGKISERQLSWTIQGFETKNRTYLNKIKTANKKQLEISQKIANKNHLEFKEQKNYQSTIPIERSNSKENQQQNENDKDFSLKTEFQLLVQKMRLAELQEKQVDEQLIKYDLSSIEQNKKLCEIKLQEANRLKKDKIRYFEQIQKQKRLQQQLKMEEIQAKLIRQAEIYRDGERLKNLQKKVLHYTENYTPTHIYDNRRLYSFSEESPQVYKAKPFQIIDAHIPLPRKDYKNLTNLNSLSIVESHRKGSGRSEVLPWTSDTDAYIKSANEIRQKIKKEMQIQKQIQQKFSRGQYNTSRFNSRISNKQESFRDNGLDSGDSKVKQIIQIDNGSLMFESPQRTAAFRKSGSNKFTVSTGNKLSSQKV